MIFTKIPKKIRYNNIVWLFNSIEESSWLSNRKINLFAPALENDHFAHNKFKISTYDGVKRIQKHYGRYFIWLMEQDLVLEADSR
jgi:hypothetical protein